MTEVEKLEEAANETTSVTSLLAFIGWAIVGLFRRKERDSMALQRLVDRYHELVALAAERLPGYEPPPMPAAEAGPNAFVNANQMILAALTGRTATRIKESTTPFKVHPRAPGA